MHVRVLARGRGEYDLHQGDGIACALQIMGSEVGVVDVPHWDIASKGRLMPGNIFLVDFEAGRVIKDEEVRAAPDQAQSLDSRPYAGASAYS